MKEKAKTSLVLCVLPTMTFISWWVQDHFKIGLSGITTVPLFSGMGVMYGLWGLVVCALTVVIFVGLPLTIYSVPRKD